MAGLSVRRAIPKLRLRLPPTIRDKMAEREHAPEPKQVDAIALCLKRILKSVNRWNKSGGQRGYLTFIVQYVR
jgi:hypothetical protein